MITANGFNFYFHFWFSKNQLFWYVIPTILDLNWEFSQKLWAMTYSVSLTLRDDSSDLIGRISDKKN